MIAFVENLPEFQQDEKKKKMYEIFEQSKTFMSDRIRTKDAVAYNAWRHPGVKKKMNLEKKGKLLVYRKVDGKSQQLLDAAREKEWGNWKSLAGSKLVSAKQAEELRARGSEELPSQWIELDKNEALRVESGEHLDPKMKSRLVARGDMSTVFARTDSPTADKESVFLVISFAASRRLILEGADLLNGYFQGEQLSKPLLLRQPPGGVPEPGAKYDDRIICFVPIYGTKDAGRGLYRRVRKIFIKHGLHENMVLNALYSFSVDGVVMILCATHVDDWLFAVEPAYRDKWEEIKKELAFGSEDKGSFRFCGTEIEQDLTTFSVKVTCKATFYG